MFGPLKYALLVMNKETNTSKGCAFIHFKNREDGIKVLKRYEELNPPTSSISVPKVDKNGRLQKTIIPSQSLDNTFVVGGRHLTIHTAVSPDDVRQLCLF